MQRHHGFHVCIVYVYMLVCMNMYIHMQEVQEVGIQYIPPSLFIFFLEIGSWWACNSLIWVDWMISELQKSAHLLHGHFAPCSGVTYMHVLPFEVLIPAVEALYPLGHLPSCLSKHIHLKESHATLLDFYWEHFTFSIMSSHRYYASW